MKIVATQWVLGALALSLCAFSAEANAQARHLQLHDINFDLWCQETQNLPPDRCDKRLPEDDAAFERYVDTIERYETQKLDSEARERRFDRDILHNDPIDNPTRPSEPQTAVPQN